MTRNSNNKIELDKKSIGVLLAFATVILGGNAGVSFMTETDVKVQDELKEIRKEIADLRVLVERLQYNRSGPVTYFPDAVAGASGE